MDNKKNKFILYDNGENFTAKNVQFRDLRTEQGLFTFRYDPSYDGNIRKMYIILPGVKKVSYQSKPNEVAVASNSDGNKLEEKFLFIGHEWKPQSENSTMLRAFEKQL
jgi:hypothetical protein